MGSYLNIPHLHYFIFKTFDFPQNARFHLKSYLALRCSSQLDFERSQWRLSWHSQHPVHSLARSRWLTHTLFIFICYLFVCASVCGP